MPSMFPHWLEVVLLVQDEPVAGLDGGGEAPQLRPTATQAGEDQDLFHSFL